VRCLGPDAVARIEARRAAIGLFDVAVLVLDDWQAAMALGHVGQVEVLPDAEARSRLCPSKDWDCWEARRLRDIRYDWAPDFEITL
jgi:hypothetical protein